MARPEEQQVHQGAGRHAGYSLRGQPAETAPGNLAVYEVADHIPEEEHHPDYSPPGTEPAQVHAGAEEHGEDSQAQDPVATKGHAQGHHGNQCDSVVQGADEPASKPSCRA
jgi:hypothetical protein